MIECLETLLACTWDVVGFVLLITLHWAANRQDRRSGNIVVADLNIHLLATACSGGIVAISILASAAMIVLTNNDLNVPFAYHICHPILRAVCWFVASLFMGLLVLSLLPMFSPTSDPRRCARVIVPYFGQFLALAIGATWLIVVLWNFLN